MNPIEKYIADRDLQVRENHKDKELEVATYHFTEHLVRTNYTKNFTWRGVPILQYPTDLIVMQELIHQVSPDRIIETGIAFGGMSCFYADMMNIIKGEDSAWRVLSIDKEIRPYAEEILKKENITHFEGSSTDRQIFKFVMEEIGDMDCLVSLDSNHTMEHVFEELMLYSRFVSVGSYIVVFDTAIDTFGHLDKNQDRPWNKTNNPAIAVREFLKIHKDFVVDKDIEQRALITAAPGGWLRRIFNNGKDNQRSW